MEVPVSVIIPYRNAQATFAEALESVRSQTHQPAEVIVVDDGSDAEGRRFLDDIKDDFVLIRFSKRRGPGPARNAGVAAATQPYVAFLDADDRWMPSKLRIQYQFMHAHPDVDVTHTGSVVSWGNGSGDGHQFARVNHRPRDLTVPLALAEHQMTTPSLMMHRSAFDRMGGFDPRFRCTQDFELQIRMALAGYRMRFLSLPLTWIRRENHGNHSGNWRCYLAGHMGILLKHRRTYAEHLGYRYWFHLVARAFARAGHKQGGWLGRGLRVPAWLGF